MKLRFYHRGRSPWGRLFVFLLLFGAAAAAGSLEEVLRDLSSGDEERRTEALALLARGGWKPETEAQRERLVQTLRRRLRGRSATAEERGQIARALGRLGGESAFQALVSRLGREQDDRALAGLWEAFARAPESRVRPLREHLAAAEDPIERAVVLGAMGRMRHLRARSLVRIHARTESHPCPRAAAVQALGRDRDRRVVPLLVETLDDRDPGVRAAAFESLTRLTGKRLGPDPDAWKAWWKEAKERPESPLGAAPEARPVRYAHEVPDDPNPPYWFDIPVRGARVAFCYDVSASMRYKLPVAYAELIRAVKGLGSQRRFEVVFFNEKVTPWRGRLSAADPVTKELLARHLSELEIKSYTNLFGALETALELPVDEIFVISDGLPNRGRLRVPDRILEELRELNRRRLPIHTVSVVRNVDGDEHQGLLRRIAEQTGGKHVARSLH